MSLTIEQQHHLDAILVRLTTQLSDKYQRGQEEHGGNLWLKSGLLNFAIEEVLDLVVYLFTLDDQLQGLLAKYDDRAEPTYTRHEVADRARIYASQYGDLANFALRSFADWFESGATIETCHKPQTSTSST